MKSYPLFDPGDEGSEYQHLVAPYCLLIRVKCRGCSVKQEIISQLEIRTPSGDLLPHPGRSLAQVSSWDSALWVWLRLILEWQFGNRTALETEKRKGALLFRHC